MSFLKEIVIYSSYWLIFVIWDAPHHSFHLRGLFLRQFLSPCFSFFFFFQIFSSQGLHLLTQFHLKKVYWISLFFSCLNIFFSHLCFLFPCFYFHSSKHQYNSLYLASVRKAYIIHAAKKLIVLKYNITKIMLSDILIYAVFPKVHL